MMARDNADAPPDMPDHEPGGFLDIPEGTQITQNVVAELFAKVYRSRFAYCHDRGRWLENDNVIWRPLRVPVVSHLIRQLCQHISIRVSTSITTVQSQKFTSAVEAFAKADPAFSRDATAWDANPMLLGTPDGIIDLKSGVLRPQAKTDNITKSTSVSPEDFPDCPVWLNFLRQATKRDEGMIRYLQQICGYCLTGLTIEQCLFFIYGTGGNGKGVFASTIQGILGDYAQTANMEMLEKQKFSSHKTELAALVGARAVFASETEEGGSWNEKRVKGMTGGDKIRANFMRQDEFEFDPEFKLIIAGNHKPALRTVDEAMRRRFNIIPFTHKPLKRDLKLVEKLRAEWPGILRWMILGCLDWQENGLMRPQAVIDATEEYFEDQNTLAQWIEDACNFDALNEHLTVKSQPLFDNWSSYAKKNNITAGTSKTFKAALEAIGCVYDRRRDGSWWRFIELRQTGEEREF